MTPTNLDSLNLPVVSGSEGPSGSKDRQSERRPTLRDVAGDAACPALHPPTSRSRLTRRLFSQARGRHRATLEMTSRASRKVASPGVVCIEDLRSLAGRRVPKAVFDYLDGGAEGEVTLRENCRAFEDVIFRPRHAVSISDCDLRTRVLGFDLSLPFLLAPVGNPRAPRNADLARDRGVRPRRDRNAEQADRVRAWRWREDGQGASRPGHGEDARRIAGRAGSAR